MNLPSSSCTSQSSQADNPDDDFVGISYTLENLFLKTLLQAIWILIA